MAMTLPLSFWENVKKTDSCWIWIANTGTDGYGRVRFGGKRQPAHRLAYEAVHGAVDPSLDMDHLCRTRACVNPAHLEPVTRAENLLRSPITLTAQKASQIGCINGHAFTQENTNVRPNGTRRCRECARARDRAYYARKRVAIDG